jgi:hypothetical protein
VPDRPCSRAHDRTSEPGAASLAETDRPRNLVESAAEWARALELVESARVQEQVPGSALDRARSPVQGLDRRLVQEQVWQLEPESE